MRKDKQCQPEDDNNENAGKLKDQETSESTFQAVQDTYTVTALTKQTPENTGPGLLESECQVIAGSLQQRAPGLAKWCLSEHSLKQSEAF